MNENSKRERATYASKVMKSNGETAHDSPAKERYDLRSILKAKKPSAEKSNGRMSWAEMCEAADDGVEFSFDALSSSPDVVKRRVNVVRSAEEETSVSSPFKALTFTSPDAKDEVAPVDADVDGVKRRLGFKNAVAAVVTSPDKKDVRRRAENAKEMTKEAPMVTSPNGKETSKRPTRKTDAAKETPHDDEEVTMITSPDAKETSKRRPDAAQESSLSRRSVRNAAPPPFATPRESSGRKKQQKREVTQSPSTTTIDGVKRRLGWSRVRNADDGVSTEESSSICSSEDYGSGTRFETDPDVLRRRQKQIDYGKNTRGYRLYLAAVPKESRKPDDVCTPKKHVKYSRRSWDAQIKVWRKRLHLWDKDGEDEDEEEDVDLSDMKDLL